MKSTCRLFDALAAGVIAICAGFPALHAEEPASREALWKQIEPFCQPPEEYANDFGTYRSPLSRIPTETWRGGVRFTSERFPYRSTRRPKLLARSIAPVPILRA